MWTPGEHIFVYARPSGLPKSVQPDPDPQTGGKLTGPTDYETFFVAAVSGFGDHVKMDMVDYLWKRIPRGVSKLVFDYP